DAATLKVPDGQIEFHDVCFTYQASPKLFENKSILIEPGQKVGLVGYSGSGKTTFVNLISRFYDVSAGMVCIDGQNIAHVTQRSLRENIGFIPQEPVLFHRSIM